MRSHPDELRNRRPAKPQSRGPLKRLEIPNLLAKLDDGYDLVSGWKRNRRDPLSRRIVSRIYNRATALVTGVRLHDMNCGLKAYRAEVLQNVPALRRAPSLRAGARAPSRL